MKESRILVFADGAAKGNPGPGGWGAIALTLAGEVTELGGGSAHTTNNQMELTGAIEALGHLAREPGPVDLYTDSTYVIRGITEWIGSWRQRGWRTAAGKDVMNRDLWETLSALVAARGRPSPVAWHYVRGHTQVAGNERADAIAAACAAGRRVDLYRGPAQGYQIALRDVPDETGLPARGSAAPRRGKRAPPHSYLSAVGGRPMRHATWADCERRVKGKSGARFKKAMTAGEEAEILAAWGFSEDDL